MRFSGLIFGLFLFSLGIAMTMKANLGFAPWDVFHQGISNKIGLSIGNVSILIGLFICLGVALAGEKLGMGTILNMLLIGFFLDRVLELGLIPPMDGFLYGLLMMTAGLFVISLGTYFYMGSGFGAGPRDGLMVVLERKTGLPVGLCRAIIESLAVFLGWLMGGPVGLGTVIAAFGIGLCVQVTFSLLKFQATEIRHETFRETLEKLGFKKK
ncbi:MAG TPA: hypothetical protein PLP89_07700 [Synergistales bacterium]|nr:hypothetical protein [Synergistales bacterium]MDI9392224.1 hypothetical protein [Synergistota bacterium]MDY0178917.1 hypothetical protein [Synergistaceae bacterium]HRW87787.1 hypothetical protein [Thermovirgaceae bacterium]MDD3134072.1 hypothetical protein [Synergistales bacterium]